MNHGDLTANVAIRNWEARLKISNAVTSDRRFSGKNMFADDWPRSVDQHLSVSMQAPLHLVLEAARQDLMISLRLLGRMQPRLLNFLLDVCHRLPLHNVSRVAQARGFDCGVYMIVWASRIRFQILSDLLNLFLSSPLCSFMCLFCGLRSCLSWSALSKRSIWSSLLATLGDRPCHPAALVVHCLTRSLICGYTCWKGGNV